MVVERADTHGLCVVIIGAIDHMTIPQGVVDGHETAQAQHAHRHLIGFDIGALVAVDEGKIESYSQPRCQHVGIANGEDNLLCPRRLCYPWAGEILHFIVHFERVEAPVGGQSGGHAECTVTAEGAHLKHPMRPKHRHEHL